MTERNSKSRRRSEHEEEVVGQRIGEGGREGRDGYNNGALARRRGRRGTEKLRDYIDRSGGML